MASIEEVKAAIDDACVAIEQDVIARLDQASTALHAERNVLLVTLDKTHRDEVLEALHAMTSVVTESEHHSARLLLVVTTLRAYAASL